MSPRCTCCWPVVATTSPAVSGCVPKLRFSAWAEPCRRILCCAGAKTTRVAGFEFGLADLDIVARADLGIGALEAVEADDLEPLVLGIGPDRARGVVRLPTISITSPSAMPSDFIRSRERRAKPRPPSAGGRFATCTRVEVTRSKVSVSATQPSFAFVSLA